MAEVAEETILDSSRRADEILRMRGINEMFDSDEGMNPGKLA